MEISLGQNCLVEIALDRFLEPSLAPIQPWKVTERLQVLSAKWAYDYLIFRKTGSKKLKSNNKNTQVVGWYNPMIHNLSCDSNVLTKGERNWQPIQNGMCQPHLSVYGLSGMKLGDYRRSKSDNWAMAKDLSPKDPDSSSEVKPLYGQENKIIKGRNIQRETDSHGFQCSRSQGSYSCLLWGKGRKSQIGEDLFRTSLQSK